MTMLLLLPALAEAQQAVKCRGPLSEAQLTELVKGSVPATRIGQLVGSCGIAFEPAVATIGRLRSAGAPETVLAAVRAATGPAARKRQVEQVIWDSIKDSQDSVVFFDYFQYPEAPFAEQARQRYRDLKVAGMRVEMERSLAAGQWDAAEAKIRDLLRIVPENDEISGWRQRVSDGREAERKQKEAAAVPKTKVNPKDGLTYVWIPSGTFRMGCSPGDAECFDNEKPAHEVTITRGFWLGRTPVTQQAYQRMTGQNPSHFKSANLPVENVNWSEAKAYCIAIGGRLPTEGEWEYAARAGSTGARYGDLAEVAWYKDNSGRGTHEVGQKPANGFGLYDMLGNVWEWVAEWCGNYQSRAQSGASGALRGGSWNDIPGRVRASSRVGIAPSYRNLQVGFRCAGE